MFVTESRYGNRFCQPGEILRQAGRERNPPGAAALPRHGRAPSADPFHGQRVGETEARSWWEPGAGSERGNPSRRSYRERRSPSPIPLNAFSPHDGCIGLQPPRPQRCGRSRGFCGAGWGGCRMGGFGHRGTPASLPDPSCPRATSGPHPPLRLPPFHLWERFSFPADKQAPGCKCHHRNRCYLKQTRALLTLKFTGFLHA